jgi:hypothetical protein
VLGRQSAILCTASIQGVLFRYTEIAQPRSTAIIVFLSAIRQRAASTGGVQERWVSKGAFAAILNPCGEGCALIRLPSWSRVISWRR